MGGISLEAFRAVAQSSYSDSRHVYVANEAQTEIGFNGAKSVYGGADGAKTKIVDAAGKPRKFTKPQDRQVLENGANYLRNQLARVVSEKLGGTGTAAYDAIWKKIFGGEGGVPSKSDMPLKKREIMDVLKMMDDEIAFNAKYDSLPPLTRNTKDGVVTKNHVQTARLCSVLDNKKLVKAADDGKEIVSGSELAITSADRKQCTKNPFRAIQGGTSDVVKTLHEEGVKEGKPRKICAQVFADATYFLCYFRNSKCGSQEEFLSHDTEPKSFLNVVKGFVKKAGSRFKYLTGSNGAPLLSTIKGWMKKCKLAFASNERIAEPIEANYLFSSMPSLTDMPESFDVKGNVEYMCQCKELLGGAPVTKKERKNAIKFIEKFNEPRMKQWKKAGDNMTYKMQIADNDGVAADGLTSQQFKDAVKIMLFSGDPKINALSGKTSSGVKALRNLVKQGNYDDLLKKANENYERTVRASVRNWIVMAQKAGNTHLVGGPIGTGAFANDSALLAKIIAEEFVQYGGDMEYVFPDRSNAGVRDIFEKAFETAWKNRNNPTEVAV